MLQNDLPEVINDQLSAQLAVYSKAHALIASAKVLLRDKKLSLQSFKARTDVGSTHGIERTFRVPCILTLLLERERTLHAVWNYL